MLRNETPAIQQLHFSFVRGVCGMCGMCGTYHTLRWVLGHNINLLPAPQFGCVFSV